MPQRRSPRLSADNLPRRENEPRMARRTLIRGKFPFTSVPFVATQGPEREHRPRSAARAENWGDAAAIALPPTVGLCCRATPINPARVQRDRNHPSRPCRRRRLSAQELIPHHAEGLNGTTRPSAAASFIWLASKVRNTLAPNSIAVATCRISIDRWPLASV